MSSYNPPIENLPIFDTILFREANGDTLTRSEADRRYLKFPLAQGTETLKNTNINGTLSLTANTKNQPSAAQSLTLLRNSSTSEIFTDNRPVIILSGTTIADKSYYNSFVFLDAAWNVSGTFTLPPPTPGNPNSFPVFIQIYNNSAVSHTIARQTSGNIFLGITAATVTDFQLRPFSSVTLRLTIENWWLMASAGNQNALSATTLQTTGTATIGGLLTASGGITNTGGISGTGGIATSGGLNVSGGSVSLPSNIFFQSNNSNGVLSGNSGFISTLTVPVLAKTYLFTYFLDIIVPATRTAIVPSSLQFGFSGANASFTALPGGHSRSWNNPPLPASYASGSTNFTISFSLQAQFSTATDIYFVRQMIFTGDSGTGNSTWKAYYTYVVL